MDWFVKPKGASLGLWRLDTLGAWAYRLELFTVAARNCERRDSPGALPMSADPSRGLLVVGAEPLAPAGLPELL